MSGLDFWVNIGKSVALAKGLPTIVDQGYHWALDVSEGDLDSMCEVLPPVQARALRRAVAAIRDDPATRVEMTPT